MTENLALTWAVGDLAFGLLVLFAALGAWVATSRRTRSERAVVAFVAALTCAGAITATAHTLLRRLGAPAIDIERADTRTVTLLRRWSAAQRRTLALASMSPMHRRAVRAHIDRPLRETGPFPPRDDASVRLLRAWARAHHHCALDVALDRRLGDFARAASTTCTGAAAAREAAEAALAMGDVATAWQRIAPVRAEVHDGFDGRLLTLLDTPPAEALTGDLAVPAHERPLWRCVLERLRQHARGDNDADVWTPMLASDYAACRILAATAPARRDEAARRALLRLPPHAQRAWRHALTTARVLLHLGGKLPVVPCLSRRMAMLDTQWLTRYPAIAALLLRETHDEGCALTMDRVWFPAMQALAWHEASDPAATELPRFEDFIVGWQLIDGAWERMRTVVDPRFTRARRQRLERAVRGAFGPVGRWAVGRLDAAWSEGRPWPQGYAWTSIVATIDTLTPHQGWDHESMRHVHDIPHYAIEMARRWNFDAVRMPAHSPELAAWIEYWRTGEFAPAHDAPAATRDDVMRRMVAAAVDGNPMAVHAVLDAPSIARAEALAVVAYRLRGDTSVFESWLRRAWATVDVATISLAAWQEALETLRTCALRLRLGPLRVELEQSLVRVRRLRSDGDGFVQAVLDGPRPPVPQPDPYADDEEEDR